MSEYEGRSVSKTFVNATGKSATFSGTVRYLGPAEKPYCFEVLYTDGDKETMSLHELTPHLLPAKGGSSAAGPKAVGPKVAESGGKRGGPTRTAGDARIGRGGKTASPTPKKAPGKAAPAALAPRGGVRKAGHKTAASEGAVAKSPVKGQAKGRTAPTTRPQRRGADTGTTTAAAAAGPSMQPAAAAGGGPAARRAQRGSTAAASAAAAPSTAPSPTDSGPQPFTSIYISEQQHAQLWAAYKQKYDKLERARAASGRPLKYTTEALMQRDVPVPTFRVRRDGASGWGIELLSSSGRSLGRCSTLPSPDGSDAESYRLDRWGHFGEVANFCAQHAARGFTVAFDEGIGCGLGSASSGSVTLTAMRSGSQLIILDDGSALSVQ